MHAGKLVFAQLMGHLPLHTFRLCVAKYPSRYPTLKFSHLDQFLSMAFAQQTYRESLRDIETCLRAHQTKFYHLGIRGKSNLLLHRLYSRPVGKATGLRYDKTVTLAAPKAKKDYPQYLRRIKFHDTENNKDLVFITNHFDLPALTIAELYRCRWQVELFFHARIICFSRYILRGCQALVQVDQTASSDQAILRHLQERSKNTDMDCYLCIRPSRHRKKRLRIEASLYTILQILSLTIFEKTSLDQLLKNMELQINSPENDNQLNLFS